MSLSDALARFREEGSRIVGAECGEAGLQLWSTACDLVEALLLGVTRHLSEVSVKCELHRSCAGSAVIPGGGSDLVALVVHLHPAPLYGEIATRSRIGADLCLQEVVTFALRQLPADAETEPLVLEMDGIHFAALPEIAKTRDRLKHELGPDRYTPEGTYEWWVSNVHEVCPLETSKMHRVLESIMGMRGFQLTCPSHIVTSTPWAMINAVSTCFDAFQFCCEGSAGIRITARRPEPTSSKETEERDQCDEILQGLLVRDQAVGEVFAASSFNFMRLIHGHTVGQPGASAEKIIKLLTAAKTWGGGTDGWQKSDRSWQVTDRKNYLGSVVEKQGRLIWGLAPS